MKWVKRIIIFLVVGFALFYLIAQPENAANAVQALFAPLRSVPLGHCFLSISGLVSHGRGELARSACRPIRSEKCGRAERSRKSTNTGW
jgi:hypothetical protein